LPAGQLKHVLSAVAAVFPEYLPAGQSVHAEPSSEYIPARQFTQSAKASDVEGEDLPAGQLKHVLSVLAAVFPEYLPAGQLKHVLSAVAAVFPEYLPAGQSVHAEPSSEYIPARQFTQSAKASDVEGEDLPAGQLKHVLSAVAAVFPEYLPARQLTQVLTKVAPVAVEYLPASQLVHEEPTSEYLPARQFMQAVKDVDPEGDDLPGAQLLHTEAPAAEYLPAVQLVHAEAPIVEYVPAGQSVQTESPVTDLYFPAEHLTQSSWSGPVNPGLHTQLSRPTEPLTDSEQRGFPPQSVQAAQSV
jgi:hypothetical protein